MLRSALAVVLLGLGAPTAHAAGTLNVHDEGHLHFISDSATTLIDEGRFSGTYPGKARVDFAYNGSPSVTAHFTIHGPGGSITGQAQAKLSNPTSPSPSFRGSLRITGGSGRYAHARGSGVLSGVFQRRGYGLIVQAVGKLQY